MPVVLLALFALSVARPWLGLVVLLAGLPFKEIAPRAGLGNAFQKMTESQQSKAYTKITYFGGSITAGPAAALGVAAASGG